MHVIASGPCTEDTVHIQSSAPQTPETADDHADTTHTDTNTRHTHTDRHRDHQHHTTTTTTTATKTAPEPTAWNVACCLHCLQESPAARTRAAWHGGQQPSGRLLPGGRFELACLGSTRASWNSSPGLALCCGQAAFRRCRKHAQTWQPVRAWGRLRG